MFGNPRVPRLRTLNAEAMQDNPHTPILLHEAMTAARGTDPLLTSFFRQLFGQYGKFVDPDCLRHAICVYIASQVFRSDSRLVCEYKNKAYRSLSRSLTSPCALFTSFILAWCAYCENTDEFAVHASGCSRLLSIQSRSEWESDLSMLVQDKLFWMMVVCNKVVLPYSPFRCRLRYFEHLKATANPPEAWQDGWMEAVNDGLCDILRLLLVCLYDFWKQESRGEYVGEVKLALIQFVQGYLADPDLNYTLATMKRQAQLSVLEEEKQVMELQFAVRATIELLLVLLQAGSIYNGFSSVEAQAQAVIFCNNIKDQGRLSTTVLRRYYFDYSLIGITLAGLILGKSDINNCITLTQGLFK